MKFYLSSLSTSGKVSVTLFLVLLWFGYILAGINASLAVGLSAEAIADHYGNVPASTTELKTIEEKGFIEEEIDIEDFGEEDSSEDKIGIIAPQELVQLGHIHILGFSLLFITLGLILSFTRVNSEALKILIMFPLFFFFAFDIGGLFFVRFISRKFAIIPLVSGIGIGIGIGIISLMALYDMWIRRA